MSKIEVKKITLFGAVVGEDHVPPDSLLKVFPEIANKLETRDETILFEDFKDLVYTLSNVLYRLCKPGTRFETPRDFDIATLKALVEVREKLKNAYGNLRKRDWFLLWNLLSRGNEYRLVINMTEVTDGGWIYLFEAEFNIMYNPDTKTTQASIGIGYRKYISITEPYITDDAVKYEIAKKLFRNPVTGVVEVEILTDQ